MLHFGTRSTKGKNLLECNNKLFSKVKFTRKDNEITKLHKYQQRL
jgi:hypothetical protein